MNMIKLFGLVSALVLAGCCVPNQEKAAVSFRVLYWNIQNGMWDGQRDDYARFVAYVKEMKPDLCVWCEAESIWQTDTPTNYIPKADRYLPNGWPELAARYGHTNVFLGGHRDNYPQVVTSRLPIEGVKRIVGPKEKPVCHGAGWSVVKVAGREINLVTLHTYPHLHAPGAKDVKKSRAEHGGDFYRRYEVEEVCRETILTHTNGANECWMMMGDFNSLSPVDNPFYQKDPKDPCFLAQSFVREATPYRDIIAERHPGQLVTSTYGMKRIDYVYLTPPLAASVKSAEIPMDGYSAPQNIPGCEFKSPSDHRPIVVDFEFR